jgi:hypothetical protein
MKEARLLPSPLMPESPPFVNNKRGHYIDLAGPTKSLLHQTLVFNSWEPAKIGWLFPVPITCSQFPVPTTALKFTNHYCLLPLLLAFKSNEKPNFAVFWSFHYSGKVSIELFL